MQHNFESEKFALFFSFLFFSFELKAQQYCDTGGWNDPFNWQQPTFQMYLSPQGSQSIPSPYHSYGAFLNPNIEPLSWPASKDYDPTDGWVHIAHDFGTPSTYVPNPHLILYNRMTGILRVFFLVTQQYDQNNRATISIRFGDGSKKSALLERYAGSGMNGVTTFAPSSVQGIVPNQFSNSLPYWTFADLVMTYDPCVCNTANTKLYIELKLYKKEILNFTINGQLLQDLKPSVSGSSPTFTSTLKPFLDGLSQVNSILTSSSTLNKTVLNGSFSSFSTILQQYGGPWAGLADFLIGIFNPNKPATPVPLMFNAKFDATGSVGFEGTAKTVIIANPGSNTNAVDPANISPYNHILGTFNLIESPKVYFRKSISGVVGLTPEDCDIEHNYYQFQLVSPIIWVYNPYMLLTTVDWRAAYVVEFSDGKRVLTEDFPMGCFQDYKPVFTAERRRGGCNYTEPYPVNVYIQVLAKATHTNGATSVFMQVYNTQKLANGDGFSPLVSAKPYPGCNTPAAPAPWWWTYNCIYTDYPTRVNSLTEQDSIPEAEYLASVAKSAQSLIVKDKTDSEVNSLSISPNPINEMGLISFELIENSQISIYLTDVSGKVLKSFVQNELRNKGKFTLDFLRKDLTAGMYFVVMETNAGRVTQKLMLK